MGINASVALNGGYSSGGSSNSSWSQGSSQSYSETDAAAARAWSAQQAQIAREWQEKMFEKEMKYNAEQAQLARDFSAEEAKKQRDYSQAQVDVANEMANTVYTRSAKNMKEAGINPILAYTAGIGGAGSGQVSGGAAAGTTGASVSVPSGFMGQSFMDQHSASSSENASRGSGSSWQESQDGLATALTQMGALIKQGIDAIASSKTLDYTLNDLTGDVKTIGNDIWNSVVTLMPQKMRDYLGASSTNKGRAGSSRTMGPNLKNLKNNTK